MDAETIIIGAGAAGLMAGVWAARSKPKQRVLLLDSARKLGAKILVAGGGRCNVTHDHVSEAAYAGASRHAIKKVLRQFDVPQTIAFFRELGVTLKREDTGKLFPTTDDARTILDALLDALRLPNVRLEHPCRVEQVERLDGGGFRVSGAWGAVTGARVILATGGRSLPKSGSDGGGYRLAQALGHHLTEYIFPALVPLTLPRDHWLCALSGITVPATLDLRAASGKKLVSFTDSTLLTHFGLSGPSVLDISRHYSAALLAGGAGTAHLTINWLIDKTADQVDADILALGKTSPLRYLQPHLPERLSRALCAHIGIEIGAPAHTLTREQRRALVSALTQMPLPISGDRGYLYAEVTGGGVPLTEIHLEDMQSRVCAGLHLCGEICDVDGRIGGYNFQWAWASGYVAGNG
jgi:predicted Rossmann fold flavoprotein